MQKKYKAVLFDLLTALLDSWTVWNKIAGDEAAGAAWRKAYLNRTYACGAYRPYTLLVQEAAADIGLPASKASALEANWHQLQPWSAVRSTLMALPSNIKKGIVTNCSETLGYAAAANVGVAFDVVVTSERAGFYKPDPRPYQLALDELGTTAEETLFVAGSAFDLFGTAQIGMDTFWHNRIGMQAPANMPTPIATEKTLEKLVQYF
jgi:2-haloacid dehalogenase